MRAEYFRVYTELDGRCEILDKIAAWGERVQQAFDHTLRQLQFHAENWYDKSWEDEFWRLQDGWGDGCGPFCEIKFYAPAFAEVPVNPVRYRAVGDFVKDDEGTIYFRILDVFKKPEIDGVDEKTAKRRVKRCMAYYKESCGRASYNKWRIEHEQAITREYQP